MDVSGRSTTYFVSRYHEDTPATLKDLLRSSAKHEKPRNENITNACGVHQDLSASDFDSSSEYECGYSGDSDDEFEDCEPEVDERQLHATEPREGLYLREMRRQRGRMGEKEAEWVRGYVKAHRDWKTRTGHSIDEFICTPAAATPMKKCKFAKWDRCEQEVEGENGSVAVATRLETLLLVTAIVFICLSLLVQLSDTSIEK
ncbi:hypothetical protein DVH05_025781 [Phytophthora capsici]|nr:hypothetical protein DVH05_012175 [Phytophthora capsici]KAG1688479.1 hypothetical protein DVH05_003681 [Phytophthora capsici]KAG1692162.1 hypothetical protein DVH05_025781 [Phytophthora capsici]